MARSDVEERLREICCIVIESVAEGVIAIDLNNKIQFLNQAAEKITGFNRDEAVGNYCFDILRSNICQKLCVLEETLSSRQGVINKPAIIINKHGKEIPISVSTSILYDDDGEIIGGIETFRDLSVEETLRREIEKSYAFENMVSKNMEMQRIFSILPDIAESGIPVLIQGESGTGKELVARAIHDLSTVHDGPFVEINCAAIPDTLLESEFFGYVKGAFTDAKSDKRGRILMADGGTLFLDEIGELPQPLQAKLLRVIEDRELTPVGSVKPIKVNVRFVAATNRNLALMMEEGSFRKDLYFRLDVAKISLPPLRERREDIPLLVDYFIEKLNVLRKKSITGVSSDVMSIFMQYPFPGNVRELENALEYAFILCKGGVILKEHLPQDLLETNIHLDGDGKKDLTPLESAEAKTISKLLNRHKNMTEVAKILGISRTTLWRKVKRYRIKG